MKSIKLAIIALLGFSTACSTVKEGTKSKKVNSEKEEITPSIVVMYGVRRPVEQLQEVKKIDSPTTDERQPAVTTGTENK